jgi:hypothetical protein
MVLADVGVLVGVEDAAEAIEGAVGLETLVV